MVAGDVLSGDNVKIYIAAVDTIGTALVAGDEYQAEVTAANTSGGEIDYESKAVFGGFIDLKKPQAQITVTLDVILRFGTDVTQWDTLNTSGVSKMIAIEATDGGTEFYWNAFNNVRTINFDKEFAADGEWKGTMTFKLSASDAAGISNLQNGGLATATDATNGIVAWV